MPLKRLTVAQLSKELQQEQIRNTQLKSENALLKKELDERAEKYNFTNVTTPVHGLRTEFLKKDVKRRIYSTSDLQQFVGEIFLKGLEIIGRKNHDYGDHVNADPFGNFRR